MKLIYKLPDGLSREDIKQHLGKQFHLVYTLMTSCESLGNLVFRGRSAWTWSTIFSADR